MRMKDKDDDELTTFLEEEMDTNKHFLYAPIDSVTRIHHIYLNNIIEEAHHYSKMFHIMATSKQEDIVYLHINTKGGYLSTGVQIINHIRTCPARVIAAIEAECYSMGAMIFLAAESHIVHDNCIMLLHNYSGGTSGKGNEQELELKTTLRWFSELSKEIFVPFISEDELKRMMKGEDIWMTSKEIRSRLKKVEKFRKDQQKEYVDDES